MNKLHQIYAAMRRNGRRKASDALRIAREWMETDRTDYPGRYTTPRVWRVSGACGAERNGKRWCEDPAAIGLRYHGDAQQIAGLRHSGWFVDCYQDETTRGVVYRLPHGRFLAAHTDPHNDGPVCIDLDVTDCEVTAAGWADQMAERYADESREHDAAYRSGREAKEAASDATAAARTYVESVRQLRDVIAARHIIGRAVVRRVLRDVRRDCAALIEARDNARQLRQNVPCGEYGVTWRDAYDNG